MADGHGRVKTPDMDIVITAMIIAIIGLSILPFFLLSSAFGAPRRDKKVKDRGDGPITPTPTDASAPFPGLGTGGKKRDSDTDSDSDGGGDGGDGGGGAD